MAEEKLTQRELFRRGRAANLGTLSKPAFEAEEAAEMARMNREGHSLRQIAISLGTCAPTVRRTLERHGYQPRIAPCGRSLTAPEMQDVCSAYKADEPLESICARHRITKTTLYKVLARNRVSVHGPRHRYRLNEHAFDDAPASAAASYYVGLLLADGCVARSYKSFTICLRLAEQDRETVERFRQFVGSSHKLGCYQPKDTTILGRACRAGRQVRLTFASTHMAETLARYGVGPRKSVTACLSADLAGSRDAWRGAIDGDGYLGIYRKPSGSLAPEIGLTGSLPCVQQFAAFARTLTPTEAIPAPKTGCWCFRVVGQHAYVLAKHLYEGAAVAMRRKLTIAQEIMATCAECGAWKPVPKPLPKLSRGEMLDLRIRLGGWNAVQKHFRLGNERFARLRGSLGLTGRCVVEIAQRSGRLAVPADS